MDTAIFFGVGRYSEKFEISAVAVQQILLIVDGYQSNGHQISYCSRKMVGLLSQILFMMFLSP